MDRTALVLALLVASMACTRTPQSLALHWRQAAPGLEYARATVRPLPDAADVAVHLVRVDPARFALQVVSAPADLHVPLSDAAGFRRAVHGAAAVNGGFFDPDFKPLGLLVSRGRELSKLRKVDHGVFYVAGGHAGLQHARAWQPPQDLEFAMECGPRLLIDGQPPHFKPGTARRTALGVDGQGRVVLAATDGALTLAQLAALLAAPGARGGPAVVQALNLDGGPSTMLDLDAGGVQAAVRTVVHVPVGVAVVPRAAIAAPAAATLAPTSTPSAAAAP